MKTILIRDLHIIFKKFSFWAMWAACFFVCGLLFFAYVDEFKNIQATLIAKNVDTNIMRLIIAPYLRVVSYVALFLIVCFCANLFYLECYSPFTFLYHSIKIPIAKLLTSKILFLLSIITIILIPILLPILALSFYAPINIFYLLSCIMAFIIFLFEVGMLTLCFSKCNSNSTVTIFLTTFLIIAIETIVKLIPSPIWINKIIAYLSPISHLEHILLGEFLLSDAIFFITIVFLINLIIIRMFVNDKLPN